MCDAKVPSVVSRNRMLYQTGIVYLAAGRDRTFRSKTYDEFRLIEKDTGTPGHQLEKDTTSSKK